MTEQTKQIRSEVGICFKVNNTFYKKVKIKATNDDLSIKDYIIRLIEKDLGTNNK